MDQRGGGVTQLVPIMLFGWVPLVAVLFATLRPRLAVVVGLVLGWTILPNAGFELPGLPDYTKQSAISFGLLLGTMIFAPQRLSAVRFKAVDAPMAVWCLAPLASSLANGLGVYDGLASVLDQLVAWGLPYLLGRVHVTSGRDARDLALGVLVSAVLYMPLIWVELRLSPMMHHWVYGFLARDWGAMRYGGWRPRVFFEGGLALGIWMMAASLIGVWVAYADKRRRIFGVPLLPILPVLLVTTVLVKTTLAIMLLAVGLGVLAVTKWTGRRWPIYALLLIPLLYCGARTAGVWAGEPLVGVAETVFGAGRAQSLEFRFDNEDVLVERALQRPILGWGGWGRNHVFTEDGYQLTVVDGMWVIALGEHGLVGLIAWLGALLTPVAVLLRRLPPRALTAPGMASVAGFLVIVTLYAIDCLLNAMVNPIFIFVCGGLASLAVEPDLARAVSPSPRPLKNPRRRAGGPVATPRASRVPGPAAFQPPNPDTTHDHPR